MFTSIVLLAMFSMTSAFQALTIHNRQATRRNEILSMKGKGGKVPINQRGEYMKQQKMMEMRKQMKTDAPSDVPVFKVYVRPRMGGPWLPAGDLAGDQRAGSLVTGMMSGFMTDMYQGQLDTGIAKSLFANGDAFADNVIANYKPFRSYKKGDLEFGYKVEFKGLEEKMGEQKVRLIVKEMEKTWIDKAKDNVNGYFGWGDKDDKEATTA